MLTCNIGESFSFLLFLSLPFSCRLFPIPYFFLIRSLSIHYSTRMCNSRFSQTKQHSPLLCCRTIPSLKHLIFPIAQTTSLAAFRVARRSPLPKKNNRKPLRSINQSPFRSHTPTNHVIFRDNRLYSTPPQYYSASVHQMLYLLSSTFSFAHRPTGRQQIMIHCFTVQRFSF